MPGRTGMRYVQRSNLDARQALQLHLQCKFALTNICNKKDKTNRRHLQPNTVQFVCLHSQSDDSVMVVIQRSKDNIWTKVAATFHQ